MTASVFLDSNLLVYAYDRSEALKQQRALEVLDAVMAGQSGVVSTQVLSEFFVTVTRKLTEPLSVKEAQERVDSFLRMWKVASITGSVVWESIRGVAQYKLNYGDAQIWAVARLNLIPTVLSEDFSEGTVLEGVRFINPFRPAFRLADWL